MWLGTDGSFYFETKKKSRHITTNLSPNHIPFLECSSFSSVFLIKSPSRSRIRNDFELSCMLVIVYVALMDFSFNSIKRTELEKNS